MPESTDEQAAEVQETVLDAQTGEAVTIDKMYAQARGRVAEQLIDRFSDHPELVDVDTVRAELETGNSIIELMSHSAGFDAETVLTTLEGSYRSSVADDDAGAAASLVIRPGSRFKPPQRMTISDMYQESHERVRNVLRFQVGAADAHEAFSTRRLTEAETIPLEPVEDDDSLQLTTAEKGKKVVTAEGELVGTVTDVTEGVAAVALTPETADTLKASLDWGDEPSLRSDHVSHITEDQIILKSALSSE